MEKVRILSTLEEIKVISDPFRLKVLFLFDEGNEALTVKQMATKLGEVPSKVHYHVKELERIGVLEIVETKEKAGIIEKFYLPTAEAFKVERSIGTSVEQGDHMLVGANLFEAMRQDFVRSNKLKSSEDKGILNYGLYHLKEEEKEQLSSLIQEFLKDKDKREDTKPYMLGYALFRKIEVKEKVDDGSKS